MIRRMPWTFEHPQGRALNLEPLSILTAQHPFIWLVLVHFRLGT